MRLIRLVDKPLGERLRKMNEFCGKIGETGTLVQRCYQRARQSELIEEILHYLPSLKRAAEVLGEALQILEAADAAEKENALVRK
jgi:hypothetical protein